MKLEQERERLVAGSGSAFTLPEVVVSSFLAGLMFMAAFGGLTHAFGIIRLDRENSRAGQILLEKMELVRLYNWEQINNGWSTNVYDPTNASVPATFTAPFYPDGANGGFLYTGTVTIITAPITETYADDLRSATVALTWASGNMTRTRSMTTYVSRYGLQNYIY
jgi:hypothetical protein